MANLCNNPDEGWLRSLWLQILPALVIAFFLWAQLSEPLFRVRLRHMVFDQIQQLQPRPAGQSLQRVQGIAIDDVSLSTYGQWPWPRDQLAQLVTRLQQMGPAAIVFDMLFAEADRSAPSQPTHPLADDRALRLLLQQRPDPDRAFADALQANPSVLGIVLTSTDSPVPIPDSRAQLLSLGGDLLNHLPPYPGVVTNLPILQQAARGFGVFSVPSDGDGIVRSMPLLYQVQGRLLPALGMEALRVALGVETIQAQVSERISLAILPGVTQIRLGDQLQLPTSPSGESLLYYRSFSPGQYLSASSVLNGTAQPQQLQGKILFIGLTAKGLGDPIHTPLGEVVPGMEAHMQLVEQALDGTTLQWLDWEGDLLAGVLLLGWILLHLILCRWRPAWSLTFLVSVLVALFALSVYLFKTESTLFDPVFPSLALLALYLAITLPQQFRTETRQRRMIEQLANHANLDGLTGLYNRRWLDNAIERLLAQAQHEGRPLCILLLDADRFKQYNDRNGHQAGDRALIALGEVLKSSVRPYDFPARYGGEEFMVLLPNCDLEKGLAVAERIRSTMEQRKISHSDGTPLPGLTLSIGLALSHDSSSGESLIAAADAQLYRAKEEGRNRCCYAPG